MSPESAALHPPLRAVRRRIRLNRALRTGTRSAVLLALLALLVLYLRRLGVIPPSAQAITLGALGLGVLFASVGGAVRPLSLGEVAKRIDVSHSLDDRFGSALTFLAQSTLTPFQQAHVRDAAHFAMKVDPRRAAPILAPRGLHPFLGLLVMIGIMTVLRFPTHASRLPEAVIASKHLVVDHDTLMNELQSVEELQRSIAIDRDPSMQALAAQLNKLIEQIDARTLTRKEAFDRLDALEQELDFGQAKQNAASLSAQLRKVGSELQREKPTRVVGEALVKEDLAKAKEELQKLAHEAEKLAEERKDAEKKMSPTEREQAARALERAAKTQHETAEKQKQEEQKRDQREKQLREEERRLRRELAQKPNDEELQRKLQRNQHLRVC